MIDVLFTDRDGNTSLSGEEKAGLKYDHVSTIGELDEVERDNINRGLIWLKTANKKNLLSLDFARTLHKRLFEDVWGWAGRFRLTNKNIGVDKAMIQSEMKKLMDDTVYWKENQTYRPIEASARFHHRLTLIHPFPNGNGRYSRIHTNLLFDLLKKKRPTWGLKINAKERRRTYILALREADAQNPLPLIEFLSN